MTKAFFQLAVIALTVLLGALIPAHAAGDDALYFAPPPHGSAFVRFINGDVPTSPLMKINGKSYAAATPGGIGIYYPVPNGKAEIQLGDLKISESVKPDGRYTAVQMDGKLTLLEETPNTNKIKTSVMLFNLSSSKDVTLKTADGKTVVIEPVQPGAVGSRSVNAVKIGFSVYAGETKVSDLEARPLERGLGYAAVVYDDAAGKPTVRFDKARGN